MTVYYAQVSPALQTFALETPPLEVEPIEL